MIAVCTVDGCSGREAGHGRWACSACVARARRQLLDTETYCTLLPSMMMSSRSADVRHSPGFASRSPARLDVIVARDIRSRTEAYTPDDEDRPTWPVLGTLHAWARWLRAAQDVSAPRAPTVTTEIGFLLGSVEWCAFQPWVADPYGAIALLHSQCRRLANDQPPRPIGRCPEEVDGERCSAALHTPTVGDTVACRRCGRKWVRAEWENLARLIRT